MASSDHWLISAIRKTGWAPGSVFVFYVVAAKVFGLYLRYPDLDIPTHFVGGIAISYFLFEALVNIEAAVGQIPSIIRSVFVFTCVGTIAGFWEFYEFIYDHLFGTNTQISISDTMSDMFFGMLGSFVFLVLRRIIKT